MNTSSPFASAIAAYEAGCFEDADRICSDVVRQTPGNAAAWHLSGLIAHRLGRHDLAAERLATAIEADGGNPDYLLNMAVVALARRRPAEAVAAARRAAELNSNDAGIQTVLGDALAACEQTDAAMEAYRRAIHIDGTAADSANNLGLLLIERRRYDEAIHVLSGAIAVRPFFVQSYNNLGRAYLELDRFDDAAEVFVRAISCEPTNALAHFNLGVTLLKLRRLSEAEVAFHGAAHAEPCTDHKKIGEALLSMSRFTDAAASFERAIALNPNDPSISAALGEALSQCDRVRDAGLAFEKSLSLDPKSVKALEGMASVYRRLNRLGAAVSYLDKARELKPFSATIEGLRYYYKQMLCDWSGFDEQISAIRAALTQGEDLISPPLAHSIPGMTESEHLKIAEAYTSSLVAKVPAGTNFQIVPDAKIRIGYLSADYFDHPVGRHIAGLVKRHDRRKFELFAYSLGKDDGSDFSRQLHESFDNFISLNRWPDDVAVDRIRADGIEILVDLGGYTERARPAIAAHRGAPVQVLYLGQGGTSGAPYMDYVIADRIVAPLAHAQFYTEALAYLPDVFINAEPLWHAPSSVVITRAELELPENAFVFCAFCSSYKIVPDVFDIWMRLLRQIPGSVLWLRKFSRPAMENLYRAAEKRGLSRDRLVFAAGEPRDRHLARMACANLFLDTLPYNGGSTATEALMAGLPVLTCMGETFVSRMAASMLTAVGLPELIATSLEDYYAKAYELAGDPDKLRGLCERLITNSADSTLFDPDRFARQLEALYLKMSSRYRQNLSPAMIDTA